MRSRKGRRLIRAFSHCEHHQGHRMGGADVPGKGTDPDPLPPTWDPATGRPPTHIVQALVPTDVSTHPVRALGDASAHAVTESFRRVFYYYFVLMFTTGCSFAESLSAQVTHRHPSHPVSVCFSLLAHRQQSWEDKVRERVVCRVTHSWTGGSLPASRWRWQAGQSTSIWGLRQEYGMS